MRIIENILAKNEEGAADGDPDAESVEEDLSEGLEEFKFVDSDDEDAFVPVITPTMLHDFRNLE